MTRNNAYLRIQLCIEKILAEIYEELINTKDIPLEHSIEMFELDEELAHLNGHVIEKQRLHK